MGWSSVAFIATNEKQTLSQIAGVTLTTWGFNANDLVVFSFYSGYSLYPASLYNTMLYMATINTFSKSNNN